MDPFAVPLPEAAPLMGLSRQQLWRMCRRGEIAYVLAGRTYLLRVATIEQWLIDHETGGAA
jgi:excisionase family DNA binding protein